MTVMVRTACRGAGHGGGIVIPHVFRRLAVCDGYDGYNCDDGYNGDDGYHYNGRNNGRKI